MLQDNDHRVIGVNQKLFFFHEYSPGSCFFLPHGTIIYNKLLALMRAEYNKRGFTEVISPNLFSPELWKISGHWDHYKDNMFSVGEDFSLKPMNCPCHCLMFNNNHHSYKDLPLRFSDFGVLHRNELSGSLTGLTRVRKFCQDDAHIFCRPDQIENEMNQCLLFLKDIYAIFGFEFEMALSTRPDDFIGSIDIWDKAEDYLKKALDGCDWHLNEKDGAFYGPKIDVKIKDSLGRSHQCATIQLDFNLPERFKLAYTNEEGVDERPIMIHRAIYGSLERMFAILTEHYKGKWPFWLSPRQICIIPVNLSCHEYANTIKQLYLDFNVELDLSDNTLGKKIRNAQVSQFNFIFVVGEKEQSSNMVNVRNREKAILGTFKHDDLISQLNKLNKTHYYENVFKNNGIFS